MGFADCRALSLQSKIVLLFYAYRLLKKNRSNFLSAGLLPGHTFLSKFDAMKHLRGIAKQVKVLIYLVIHRF